jgi:hypothetical protein
VTPQAGPAGVESCIVLAGDSFVQACAVHVTYTVANSGGVVQYVPISTLENRLLSCVLPAMPPCVIALRVMLVVRMFCVCFIARFLSLVCFFKATVHGP